MSETLPNNSNHAETHWPDLVQTTEQVAAADLNLAAGIDYELFQRCIHCGLCTASCPTFLELGDENDGPRGRIQIMRTVADGRSELTDRMRQHLKLCLRCGACETACPSGVQYSRLIEPFRLAMEQAETALERRYDWFRELILFRLLPYADQVRRALVPMRSLQHLGVFDLAQRLGLIKLIPGRFGRMIRLLPPLAKPGQRLPKFLPAVGRKRARVAFFVGCVADAMFRHIHWAALRVLQQNGCDIFIPAEQGCCGAIHFNAGDSRGARHMADNNLVAFELDRYDAILVNQSGCGSMLKQYGLYWKDGLQPHREKFSAKVQDVHEFLDHLGLVPPSGRIHSLATYHDSCRLIHAQGISSAPRSLLSKIPGLELCELPESDICCGTAGMYDLLHAEMADRLGCRKLQNILSTGASIVLAADVECMLQIQLAVRTGNHPLKVMHTMELLDLSYRSEQP